MPLVRFCIALIRRYRQNMRIIDHKTSPKLYWMNVGLGACFLSTAVFALSLGVDSFNLLWIFFGRLLLPQQLLKKNIPIHPTQKDDPHA